MKTENKTDMEVVVSTATAAVEAQYIDGVPFVVVPDGYSVETLERQLSSPRKARGFAVLSDEESFIYYTNLHKTEQTDLYYTVDKPGFKVVFNANRPQNPGWGDFGAFYDCPLSPEWITWVDHDGKRMGQEDFARFIEANLPYIVDPENAQMLEIALTLEAKKKVSFVSGLRLSNGSNEFTYEENVDGSAAKGKLKIPEKIALGIRVFQNGEAYRVEANFRYRIGEGGKLQMWYELVRPHLVIQDAVSNVRDKIQAATGLVAMNGSCPVSR